MGPFVGYSPPATYTQSSLQSGIAGILANLRIPALIGTADEIQQVNGYELFRGSSATQDNKKVGEDLSAQADGTNRMFQVINYPIVVGDGLGRVTTNTNDVEVIVNSVKVIVAKVDGLNGKIYLALAPHLHDVVTVTYFYKKTDTRIVDEDLSDQIDGTTTTFFTHHLPIVDGTNAGRPTTTIENIVVKINGAIVTNDVSHLDGLNGNFTMSSPPTIGQIIKVTYYFNMWANTYDDLPYPGETQMIRVGVSPETSNFIENIDYIIIGDQINWGTGYKLVPVVHTTGSEFFEDQIVGTLIDDRIYNEDVSSQFVTSGVTSLSVLHLPIVDGTGNDIITYDPSHVIVTIGGPYVPSGTYTELDVNRVDGETGIVYLQTAPAAHSQIFVTYWYSRVTDDTYALEVVVPGVTGVGTYTITSTYTGAEIGNATPDTVWNSSHSAVTPTWLSGPMVSRGHTIDETVTLTFTSSTQFTVTSTVVGGSSGVGVTGTTYIDSTTQLIFTLKPDSYVIANSLKIDIVENATFLTSVIPILSVGGMQLTVNNTTDITTGDITDMIVFDKSGEQPNVGDNYYVSYFYEKTDYECAFYSKFTDITNNFGNLGASNNLVLASYLMFLNGAPALILCQAKKASGSELAPDQTYFDILTRLQNDVNGINPDVIVPLTTSQAVINAVSIHCSTMSSKRNRRERIGFFGYAVGTEPMDAASYAQTLYNQRMIGLYPDGAVVELVASDGTVNDNVIDGSFLAAALAGLNVNPVYDVATPMTKKTLIGFTQLVRSLDESTMDMVATRGLTLIQNIRSSFVVRHALTTNMDSTLTREVMVITIIDFIQEQSRIVIDPFIGRKMTPNMPGQISATLGSMLASAKDSQIITDYKGIASVRDPRQPDLINVTAFFIPMFGLNWVSVSYQVQVSF
jgi:hypothetical protein